MDGNDKCLDEGTFITHEGTLITHKGTFITHEGTLITHEGTFTMHQNSEKESGSKIFKWKQALTKHFLTYSPKFLTQISRLTFPQPFLPAYMMS